MPMPIHLDEALHLFTRASPALRRYVANVPPAANAPLFADPAAIRHATVVESVETASTFSDPDGPPTKTVNSFLYTTTVRSVPSRAAWAARDDPDADLFGADDPGDAADEWLEPVSFDDECDEHGDAAAFETVLAAADPPTCPDDPWTPPARRPGERGDAETEASRAEVVYGLASSGSVCSASSIDDLLASVPEVPRDKPLIFGGVVATLVVDDNGSTRLLSGRSLIEPRTGDTLGIIRHDAETVSIISVRLTGTPREMPCFSLNLARESTAH
jgi:hypothetical protein